MHSLSPLQGKNSLTTRFNGGGMYAQREIMKSIGAVRQESRAGISSAPVVRRNE